MNGIVDFFMVRSALDGVSNIEQLRSTSYRIMNVLWADDGSGALVAEQPRGSETDVPVQWLPASDAPATELPVRMPVVSDELMHWGPTAETMSLRDSSSSSWLTPASPWRAQIVQRASRTWSSYPWLPPANGCRAVYTTGMRSYPPEKDQPHVGRSVPRSGDVWQQVALQPIGSADNPDDLGAGYINRGGVQQVTVEPQGVWLQVDAVVGAHSGTMHLLRYAGGRITVEATNTSASPGSGYVADLNGDRFGGVVLDASDAYVFCYACGVRYVDYHVLRWDGERLVPVELSLLPASAPAAFRDANNKAVNLARLNLWQDALNQLAMVAAQNQADDTGIVSWNVALIHLIGEARREAAAQDVYPILQQLFYGDYVAAVAPSAHILPQRSSLSHQRWCRKRWPKAGRIASEPGCSR